MAMLFVSLEIESQKDQGVIGYLEGFEHCVAQENLYIIITDESPKQILSELLTRFKSDSPRVIVSELVSPVSSSSSSCFYWLSDRKEQL